MTQDVQLMFKLEINILLLVYILLSSETQQITRITKQAKKTSMRLSQWAYWKTRYAAILPKSRVFLLTLNFEPNYLKSAYDMDCLRFSPVSLQS